MGKSNKPRHLIIGALPPPIGGTTVLFSQLVESLKKLDTVDITVIDTAVRGGSGPFSSTIVMLKAIGACLREIRGHDSVAFHGSVAGMSLFAPIVYALARIYRKTVIFRTFGGDFDLKFDAMSAFGKWSFRRFVLQADVVLFETLQSVSKFKEISQRNVNWYPNSRPVSKAHLDANHARESAKNFVFLGHVKPDKGVLDLIAAFERLETDVHLHICGPLEQGITGAQLNGPNRTYHGVVEPAQVEQLLSTMDVLVLPTYYQGEGYPGAILEAFSSGLPVIATNWRCIPEIVTGDSGILVTPRKVDQLVDAIQTYRNDSERFLEARQSAKKQALLFSRERWLLNYLEYLSLDDQESKLTG